MHCEKEKTKPIEQLADFLTSQGFKFEKDKASDNSCSWIIFRKNNNIFVDFIFGEEGELCNINVWKEYK